MSRRRRTESRSEVESKVETSERNLVERIDVLDKMQEDVQTVREMIADMDFGGTLEGTDELEQSVEKTEGTAVEVFDEKDQELEGAAAENEALEENLTEKRETDESDQGKLDSAGEKLDADKTRRDIEEAKETVLRDVEFLAQKIARAKEARAQAREAQKNLQGRVHSGGGGQ